MERPEQQSLATSFCADKGDYYEITDGLAQADADDTALTAKFYS